MKGRKTRVNRVEKSKADRRGIKKRKKRGNMGRGQEEMDGVRNLK